MPTPDTLQQLDPLRQEPEHRMTGFAQRIRRIAPRPVNKLPAKTVARLRAVFCLRATIETGAKHHTQEHDSQAFNACSMRAHEMEPKAQCNGRRRACIGYVFEYGLPPSTVGQPYTLT